MITNPVILHAIANAQSKLITLCHVALDSGDVYAHTKIGEKVWNGQIWLGLGELAKITGMQSADKTSRISIDLHVNDVTLINEIRRENVIASPIKLYLGVLDDDNRIAAAELVSYKVIADVNIDHDVVSVIQFACAGHRERFKNAKEYLRLTPTMWRDKHPGDSYCDDVAALAKGPLTTYQGSDRLGNTNTRNPSRSR
jgi:hypothetical protein